MAKIVRTSKKPTTLFLCESTMSDLDFPGRESNMSEMVEKDVNAFTTGKTVRSIQCEAQIVYVNFTDGSCVSFAYNGIYMNPIGVANGVAYQLESRFAKAL